MQPKSTPRSPAPALAEDPEVLAAIRPKRRFRVVGWLVGLGGLGALALCGGLWAGFGGREQVYQAEMTRQGDLVTTVTAVGALEPLDSVEIGSDLSGRVTAVLVRVNDHVHAGDVLVRLDPSAYESTVAQSRAQVRSAEASVQQAWVTLRQRELERDRSSKLLALGASTAVEVEGAQLAWEAAEAALASTQAQLSLQRATLDRAEDQLEHTVITSPIDGVVTQRLVDPGQTVVSSMAATALLQIASDLAALKAVVDVDEADVGRVAIGQPAAFTVSAWPNRGFTAEVSTLDLAPDASQSVVVYPAELNVRNDDLSLRPGMTATAEIEIDRLVDQLLVPAAALRFSPKNADEAEATRVWVLPAAGKAPTAVPVEVIASEGAWTAITASPALAAGTSVLVGAK